MAEFPLDHKMTTNVSRQITILSTPREVRMADSWHELATADHFWIRRRLEVLSCLCGPLLRAKPACCEIGCGSGILQQQLGVAFGLTVDGFDLSLDALNKNRARSNLYYYDILERCPNFSEKYEMLFLFDVLEHIESEIEFLQACMYHIRPGGWIILNVPARQELFSKYDAVVGHVRRYSIATLLRLAERLKLRVGSCSYWGLSLYPLLLIRKIMLRGVPKERVVERGFDPGVPWKNRLLLAISRLEPIPQSILGTSIMMTLQKPS